MDICRSLTIQRSSSLKLCRSNSSVLLSESISSECDGIARYQRLSESALSHECSSCKSDERRRKTGGFGFLSTIFFFKNARDDGIGRNTAAVDEMKKKKKRSSSSWLPDPNRRWPVQGW